MKSFATGYFCCLGLFCHSERPKGAKNLCFALREYELYLTHFPNLRILPLGIALAREAARVRAATRLRMPDAIQVAAACLSGADAIVTNGRRWVGRVTQSVLVLLDDYVDAG